MQTLRHDISVATYILIALHFIRLAVRRAKVSRMPNYTAETPLPPQDGYEYKVVLFYRMVTGTFRAMEFYTKTLQANNELYHQIVKAYPEYTKMIYCLLAKDNIPESVRSKSPLGAAFRFLQTRTTILTQNEYSEILDDILSIIGNSNTYRDIKIC